MKTVSAADANRHFSTILREAAKSALLERLRGQSPSGTRTWTRDALYEE